MKNKSKLLKIGDKVRLMDDRSHLCHYDVPDKATGIIVSTCMVSGEERYMIRWCGSVVWGPYASCELILLVSHRLIECRSSSKIS